MSQLKLDAKTREMIAFSKREDGGDQSFHKYYAAKLKKRISRAVGNADDRFAHESEEQRVAHETAYLLDGNIPLARGFAKRLGEDKPEELAYSASLFARLEVWGGALDEYDECFHNNQALFAALSAGDTGFVRRYAEVMPQRVTVGPQELRFIHNSILAAAIRKDTLLAAALEDFDSWKKPKKYCVYLAAILRGMLQRDGDLVASGLEDLLKGSKRIGQVFDIFKVISLETHGMYELCRWFDPSLIEGFDTNRPLPWDEGLRQWVQENERQPTFYDVTSLSPVLQQWLVELPFQADREHYWPGGVSDASLIAQSTASQPTPKVSFHKSWRVVLAKHAKKEHDNNYTISDSLFDNDENVSSHGTMFYEEKLPTGEYVAPRYPWAMCLRRRHRPWFLIAGTSINESWVKKNGKRKRTQTISAGYDAERSVTHFRMYEGGKILVDFEATGPPDRPGGKRRLKSGASFEKDLTGETTPAETLEILLEHFEARQSLLQITERDARLRLEWQNGDEFSTPDIDEAYRVSYYALPEGANPASELLDEAISEGDAEKTRRAIDEKADLTWLPENNCSPLTKAITTLRGDWRGCIRVLVEAGVPIDGVFGEPPPLGAVFTHSPIRKSEGFKQPAAIEAIDCLLDVGANINVVDSTNEGGGNTPLHHAASACQPLLVAHLLARGADIGALNDRRQTPLAVAQESAERYHASAKTNAERIVRLLDDWQAGRLTQEHLKQFLADEQQQLQNAAKDNQWRRLAKLVLLQTTNIEIESLPDFGDPDYAKPLVIELEATGFKKTGYHQLKSDLLRLRLIALHHAERRLYGVLIIHNRECFCNLMRFHGNGTACNVANAAFSNDFSPKAQSSEDLPVRYFVVPEGSVDQLLVKMDAIPVPPQGVESVMPDDFANRLRWHHKRDLEGQQRIAKRIL